MKIKELPTEERPREKMVARGKESLSNSELLAILLRNGTKDKTAIHVAEEILSMENDGIRNLQDVSIEELSRIKGMGEAKCCQILAAVELGMRMSTMPKRSKRKVKNTEDVANIFMEEMRYYQKEFFNALLLNSKGEIISIENISIGDLNSSIVHPREAYKSAVKKSAASVIFVHNHPSGDPNPSKEDIHVTKRLREAAKLLGINFLDHIIIGDGAYISFMEKKLI